MLTCTRVTALWLSVWMVAGERSTERIELDECRTAGQVSNRPPKALPTGHVHSRTRRSNANRWPFFRGEVKALQA